MTAPAPSHTSNQARPATALPSRTLLEAALTGLLGLGAAGCSDEPRANPDPLPPDAARPADAAVAVDAAPAPDAANPYGVISETEGNRTFASLQEDCDDRGGYIQIHASCSGVNACAGFSYGDWDPGVLTEHTCAGMNGCNGLSCVVLPADGGKTADDILAAELPETGSRSCMNCHALWGEEGPDLTKFLVYVRPGSGRTIDNWLDLPAEAQARMVAFGTHGTLADGTAYATMAPYFKIYSRAEIERVVDHVRGGAGGALEVIVKEMKVTDPPIAGPAPRGRARMHGVAGRTRMRR